jgi:superfamily I DNA/RNA helicase
VHIPTNEQTVFLNANGNVVLHACPGSGKTFAVAQKLMKYLKGWSRHHQGVAVLSFTNVASEEIKKQSKELISGGFEIDYPHFVGTLDSFINNYVLLRFGYLLLDPPKRPTIAFNDLYEIPFSFWKKDCYKRGCVNGISRFRWDMNKNLLRDKEPIDCHNGLYGPPCYQYKTMLLKKGLFFQSEVAGVACWLLRDNPQIAQALAARFPVIILDEAQDTSVEQMAVLDYINQAGTESMFLVGDPDQSIYEWRDASPECFNNKMNCKSWTTLKLTINFRNSQHICNATQVFAKSLEGRPPNISMSEFSNYDQRPILLLYDGSIENCRQRLINKFIEICKTNDVDVVPKKVAIVTRSRIHSETDIDNLWKSREAEFLAQSSYEWFSGSRKRAYELCEKALFSLLIKDYKDIKVSIENDIEEIMPYEDWKSLVIQIIINLPHIDKAIGDWVIQTCKILREVFNRMDISTRLRSEINDCIKIKSRDKKVPHFKKLPLRNFFENRSENRYTLSSIHGVKGETYDALMLIVESRTGNTLTPTFLNEKDIDQELMRVAYVAMTRPRKLLVVAMPLIESRTIYQRFERDKWEYLYL